MKNHTYFVYVLASRSRTLYVGITNSANHRVEQHRAPHEGFSDRYRVYRLVHLERFRYVLNAIRREKELKGWSRAKKIALIEETNPTWEDLSEKFGALSRLRFCSPHDFAEHEETADRSSAYALLWMTRESDGSATVVAG